MGPLLQSGLCEHGWGENNDVIKDLFAAVELYHHVECLVSHFEVVKPNWNRKVKAISGSMRNRGSPLCPDKI